MKQHSISFILAFLLIITIAFSSCVTKEDPQPEPTGMELNFRVFSNNAAKKDVQIGISLELRDMQDDIFIKTGRTDQNGSAQFKYLPADTYHYKLWFTDQGIYKESTGLVKIEEGSDELVTAYF